MKTVPSGLGIWCAYRPTNAAAKCAELGASWVAPRAGFDAWNDPGCSITDMLAYRSAGLKVFPWLYVTPGRTALIVDAAKHIVNTGLADGLILDPEVEFLGHPTGAAELVTALRLALPGVFIAYAPFDNRASFPDYPWAEFDVLDAAMPQTYSWEHDDRTSKYWLPHVLAQWAACPIPVWPVGCTYRPKLRAGRETPPLSNAIVAADVGWFLDQCPGDAPWSLYSLEAAPPEVIAKLKARALPGPREPLPSFPDTAATPLRAGEGEHAPPDLDSDPEPTPTSPETPVAKISSGRWSAVRPISEPPRSGEIIVLDDDEEDA